MRGKQFKGCMLSGPAEGVIGDTDVKSRDVP